MQGWAQLTTRIGLAVAATKVATVGEGGRTLRQRQRRRQNPPWLLRQFGQMCRSGDDGSNSTGTGTVRGVGSMYTFGTERNASLSRFCTRKIVQPPMPPLLVTANRGRHPLCMWETTHSASPPWLLPWQPSRWRRPWRQWREVIAVGPSRLPLAPVGTLPAAAAARFEMDEGYNNTTIQTRKRENNRVGARWSTPGVHCATGGRPRTESHTLAEAVVPTQPPPL